MNSLSSLLHVSGPDSLDYSDFYGPLSSSADNLGVEKEKNIKKDLLQINLPSVSKSHPHPSHSQTSGVGNILAKAAALRITLNLDGAPII
jgi:hypothetical protein